MAAPEISSSGNSFFIRLIGIFCPVIRRKPPRSKTAITARQRASSPEGSEIFRTNSPRVPKTAIEAASLPLASIFNFKKTTPIQISNIVLHRLQLVNIQNFLRFLIYIDRQKTSNYNELILLIWMMDIMKTKLYFLGQHDTKNNAFKPHTHTCYEMIYFISGNGIALVAGKPYSVSAQSCCIVPPNCEHTEQLNEEGKILFIGFEYDDTEYKLEQGIFQSTDTEIASLFYKIFEEYKVQDIGYQSATKSLLNVLLITALRTSRTESKQCKNLDYIRAYIEQYYNTKINFTELAALSGYSCDYFRSIFKKRFGVSPQTYMINIRLERAKEMLEATSLSCTEIAYRCGFSNSAQLSVMFKKHFGVLPSAFK